MALLSLLLDDSGGDGRERGADAAGLTPSASTWIRNRPAISELVVASDSRLRFGAAWDVCPKIFRLPRTDCVVAFAGDTHYAFPLISQLVNAVDTFEASRSRRYDITAVLRHVLAVFNAMRQKISDFPVGEHGPGDPHAEFLFAGWSWRANAFKIWRLFFNPTEDRFIYHPVSPWSNIETERVVRFAGDVGAVAHERFAELLQERGLMADAPLDMEPLEVIRDLPRERAHPSIGGAPQVVKVYRHLNSQMFGVLWPDAAGRPCVAGRPLLDYERAEVPILDPDDLTSLPRRGSGALLEGESEPLDGPLAEADEPDDGTAE